MSNSTVSNVFGISAPIYQDIAKTLIDNNANAPETFFSRVIMLLIMIIALVLNLLIVYITMKCRTMRTSSHYIILGLSLVDGLFSLVIIPSVIGQLMKGRMANGVDECVIISSILIFISGVSQWGVVFLAYDRYLSVVRGINWTGRNVCFAFFGISFSMIICIAAPILTDNLNCYGLKPSSMYCTIQYTEKTPVAIIFLIACIASILSTQVCISYCYINIVKAYVAKRTLKQPRNIALKDLFHMLNGYSKSVQVSRRLDEDGAAEAFMAATVTKIRNNEVAENSRKKENERHELILLRKSLAIIVIFFLCWTPFLIASLYEAALGIEVPPWADTLIAILVASSTGVNAAMNFIMDARYRVAFRELFW